MHNYKELMIWKRSMKLACEVYKLTAKFPSSERYELTSQLRRAVVSVPSNIAEGAGRNTNGEFVHFLGIANGSSYELSTQLLLSIELSLVESGIVEPILNELEEVQKMLFAFIEKLKKDKK